MISPEHLHLVDEWHPTKNGSLTPEDVTSFSHKKVFWLGKCGHDWEDTLAHRSNGSKCPYCSGRRILLGFNDLATTHPELAAEWHPTKNGKIKPEDVSKGSQKKVFWLGSCGHDWEAVISGRTGAGKRGCAVCSGKQINIGVNDLLTTHPELAAEWHPTKNEALKPEHVTFNSSKKVFWLGKCGHDWEAYISNRSRGAGCPYCSGRYTLAGFNDLATTHPEIASEWHPTKNGNLLPIQVSKGSDKKVFWLGSCGHDWEANIGIRTAQNTGCPTCLNRTIIPSYNDLATSLPEIAVQWHPTKNGSLTPQEVSKSSNKKVWWICENNHDWEAYIYSREKAGCRKCTAGLKNSNGEKEIKEFIEDLGFTVQQANYDIIDKGELDLYIPEKKIAIEFNGLYWHTEEKGKDRNYHYDKWYQCQSQGIQLIHIWEDDWKNKKDIVLNSLKHKLGVSDLEKIYARKTKIVCMTKDEARIFFEANHIQGYASGSLYIGLEYNGVIESALIIKRENNNQTFNIIRYATRANVIGGFSKIISFVENNYSFKEFITFSDHAISNGNLYSSNGFTAAKELKPDYMYLVDGVRKHKFGYRLEKFKNSDKLKWQEGFSEKELAKLNGLSRIWDAGKTKWVKTQD